MAFTQLLTESGWTNQNNSIVFTKGSWILTFDTSSWIEVGTTRNPRIFDVPVPDSDKEQWTLNLIVHLCETDDALR